MRGPFRRAAAASAAALLATLIGGGGPALAGEVFGAPPDEFDRSAAYIFYSHGFIVEGDDARPKHPRWGVYDFPGVAAALAVDGSVETHVVAYHRPAGTDPRAHARDLAGWARLALEEGVPPHRVSLVGFSRGGFITALAADALGAAGVNVVILAGCTGWVADENGPEIVGRFLSIYETSDAVGSCDALAAKSDRAVPYKEIAISTGEEHGAFYTPAEEWVLPTRDWIARPPRPPKND